MGHRQPRDVRDPIEVATERLVREFAREHPESSVVQCVGRCHERLLAAGVSEDLAERTETLARAMLLHPASTWPRLRAAPEPGAVPRRRAPRPLGPEGGGGTG